MRQMMIFSRHSMQSFFYNRKLDFSQQDQLVRSKLYKINHFFLLVDFLIVFFEVFDVYALLIWQDCNKLVADPPLNIMI